MFFIPVVKAGHPVDSGDPHKDERRRRRPPRKQAEPGHGDVVQISAAGYELARELEKGGAASARAPSGIAA